MIGIIVGTVVLSAVAVGCVVVARVAEQAKQLDVDGEALWPTSDPSWR